MTRPLLVLVLLVLGACAPKGNPAAPKGGSPPARPGSSGATRVELAELSPSEASLEFVLPGEVEGSRDSLLAAALGGYVEAVLVKPGDTVAAGQALARVDASIHAARRDQAQAELDQATADLERTKSMGQAVAKAQREAAETRLKMAEAGLRSAQALLHRAVISAPFAGTVASVNLEVGEVAPPGAPLIRLLQVAPAKVTVSVSDRDVVALKKGQAVTVTTDASSAMHQGVISFVSPVGDLRTRAFVVDVEVPNAERRLLPGMIARVRLSASQGKEGIVLPQYVMVTKLDEVGVFVAENGQAKWRRLKLGPVVGRQVVVEEGVKPGEKVVVTGHRELAEGDKLIAAREGVCCTSGRVVYPDEGAAR